jgi:hypothetical protein
MKYFQQLPLLHVKFKEAQGSDNGQRTKNAGSYNGSGFR